MILSRRKLNWILEGKRKIELAAESLIILDIQVQRLYLDFFIIA